MITANKPSPQKPQVALSSDWPLKIALFALAMNATALSIGAWNKGGELSRDQLAVGGITVALFLPLAVWRYAVIQRVNRAGKMVDGIVRSVSCSTKGGDTVYVTYGYEGNELDSRFTWMGPGDTPQRGDRLTLLIDPARPTRCYTLAVQRDGNT